MFFLCRLIERKSFFYANHAIWQKSWSTEYSAHCFSLNFGTECLQRRKKSLSVFVLDSKTKEDDKIVLQSWASKLAESDTAAHGPYFSAILLSLKSMERSLTNRNFLFSKQMIFLLKMPVNRNGEKLIASRRQAKISTVNLFFTSWRYFEV